MLGLCCADPLTRCSLALAGGIISPRYVTRNSPVTSPSRLTSMDMNTPKDRIRHATEQFTLKNDPSEINRRSRERMKRQQQDTTPKKFQHPNESWEHRQLVKVMKDLGLYFMHPPNEGKRSAWGGHVMFHSMGALKGAADLYVFDQLPNAPTARGLAIELKRVGGSSPTWGRLEQHDHLYELSRRGWKCFVCRGHLAAIEVLRLCGLSTRPEPKSQKFIREFVHGQSNQQEFLLE